MDAVSTNQIADILQFNDNSFYQLNLHSGHHVQNRYYGTKNKVFH